MSKAQKHNLSFTEEETTGIKSEKLSEDIHKAKHEVKKKEMKTKNNLHFEENKKKPSERLKGNAKDNLKNVPRKVVVNKAHQNIDENSDDNVSVDAINKGTESIENANHRLKTYQRRKYRNVHKKSLKEKQSVYEDKPLEKIKPENSEYKSNPYSRWKQKQNIKKEYYASKSGSNSVTSITSENVKKSMKKFGEEAEKKAAEFFAKNQTALIVICGAVLALVIGFSMVSSGSVLVQSGSGAVGLTTYPSEDSEMLSAEEYYSSLESNLQSKIDNIKKSNIRSYTDRESKNVNTEYSGEDIYNYVYKDIYHSIVIEENIDSIAHDPYELISYLTAINDCEEFTAEDMKPTMDILFSKQYILSSRVIEKTSSSAKTRASVVNEYDEEGNVTGYHIEVTETTVTHHYYTLKISLTAKSIDDLASSGLIDSQLDMYTIYQETKGNSPDLFG